MYKFVETCSLNNKKINIIMIKFSSCFVFLFVAFYSFAQIEVTSGVDEEELINTLLGFGVEIVPGSLQINCPGVAYGTFKQNANPSNIGIDQGIILTTGDAELAEGPNNEEGAFLNNFSPYTDDDLQQLVPNLSIVNACIIEFDFIPEGDMLTFDYVFGSEEYINVVDFDNFNDVFGFFVSGPGIDGEFSDDGINIALVPGTNLPVSIQTINNGLYKVESNTTFTDGPCVNCEYYVDNGDGDGFFNETWFFDATFIQYNGFTTILTASLENLQPGETYHIKLAITDVDDGRYDTGVFIKGESFSTNVPNLMASGIQGEQTFDNAVAGCVDGLFTFNLVEAYTCDVTINFDIGGTAEAGTDYTGFDQSINIPEGSMSESFQVEILDGEVGAEAKTIELYITGLSDESCGSIEIDTISLTIEAKPVFDVSDDVEIEKGESADLVASGGVSYQWIGGPNEPMQTVMPEETTDYEVIIAYGRCSENLSTKVTVTDTIDNPDPCVLSISSVAIPNCDETTYEMNLTLAGAQPGDMISITDSESNEVGTPFAFNDEAISISSISTDQTVLTITNTTNTACMPIELDNTDRIANCITPVECSINLMMGSIMDCNSVEYDLQFGITGEGNAETFTVTTADGTNLGSFNYADSPIVVEGIPISQTVLFIADDASPNCTTQTVNIFSSIQTCISFIPLCTKIETAPVVIDCTENDFTLSLIVNSDSSGDFFSVSDNLGNDLGDFYYEEVTITLGPLPLEVTSLTVSDSYNSECTIQTDDLTAAVQECRASLAMCSVSVASAEVTSCTEENYTLQLNVNAMGNGASFSVSDDSGNNLGTYNYADLPVEISNIAIAKSILTISDNDNENCSATTNDLAAAIQTCLDGEVDTTCSVTAMASVSTCTENDYTLQLIVSGQNNATSFALSNSSDDNLGTFNYAESPILIEGMALTDNVFIITDNDNSACFATTNNISVEIQDCIDDLPTGGGGEEDCTLDISAGLLTLDGDFVCDGNSPAIDLIDTTIPQGYNTYYVVHNNVNLTPASLSNTQVYALVDSNFNIDNSLIPCGSKVYVTTVIAQRAALSNVDLSVTCATFGNTVQTVFLCPISINLEELCNQATGTFILNVVVKGGLPAVQVESEFDISGDIYNGSSSNNELIRINDLPDGSEYRIEASDSYGCSTIISGKITCEKKLPVELITFLGQATDNGNLLKWATASEIENDFFTLDHSRDGVNYTPLTVVNGTGTTAEAINYEFLDRNAANGTTYYRLSQTDFDGSTAVEGFTFVTRGEDIGVNVASINPMPFVNELDVQLSSTENVFVRFSLTDLSGRLMLRNEHNLISGLTVVTLDTELIATGLYMLRIETNTGSIVKKVIKH